MSETESTKSRRTIGMWFLFFLFGLAGMMGILRVYGAVAQADFLQSIGEKINIPYLVVSGILTALAGIGGLVSVFLHQPWAPKVVLGCEGALTLLYWFDQFFFVENTTYIDMAWGFSLMVNLVLIGMTVWIITRKRVRTYYQGGK